MRACAPVVFNQSSKHYWPELLQRTWFAQTVFQTATCIIPAQTRGAWLIFDDCILDKLSSIVGIVSLCVFVAGVPLCNAATHSTQCCTCNWIHKHRNSQMLTWSSAAVIGVPRTHRCTGFTTLQILQSRSLNLILQAVTCGGKVGKNSARNGQASRTVATCSLLPPSTFQRHPDLWPQHSDAGKCDMHTQKAIITSMTH